MPIEIKEESLNALIQGQDIGAFGGNLFMALKSKDYTTKVKTTDGKMMNTVDSTPSGIYIDKNNILNVYNDTANLAGKSKISIICTIIRLLGKGEFRRIVYILMLIGMKSAAAEVVSNENE